MCTCARTSRPHGAHRATGNVEGVSAALMRTPYPRVRSCALPQAECRELGEHPCVMRRRPEEPTTTRTRPEARLVLEDVGRDAVADGVARDFDERHVALETAAEGPATAERHHRR